MSQDPVSLLRTSFDAAIAAADPLQVVAAHLPARPRGKVLVVGAGKAAASMAAAVEATWPDVPLEGVVITRYEHGLPTRHIRVVEAGHPVPDEAGEHAAAEILRARGRSAKTTAAGIGVGRWLEPAVAAGRQRAHGRPQGGHARTLRSGAPIEQMNVVRKHLSQIQGGRLAAATRARCARWRVSRRHRRRSGRHCLGAVCARPVDLCRRAASSRATAARCRPASRRTCSAVRKGDRRDAEARRPVVRACREPGDRHCARSASAAGAACSSGRCARGAPRRHGYR